MTRRTPLLPRGRAALMRCFALVLAGALALSGCSSIYDVPLPGGADVGSNPIKVHVLFRDVLDLVPQSTVKVDDVTVGKVTAIDLKGYTADVTVEMRGDVDLPDNAQATIRQTSLLGEKFVSLAAPADPSSDRLGNGDVIGLDSSGRNPEVEEVLGALAAVLSGGGVGQLKSIAEELNKAMGGREDDIRSVLDQIHYFVGQLAQNKTQVVDAIEGLNRLAGQLRAQDASIKLALDNIPAALRSVDKQRADLVRVVQSLDKLSNVGVRVIQQSKTATINTLQDLAPVLSKLAEAGTDFPESLQVSLTYPFVDEAVGRDPQVARNLHLGDYVNLDMRIDEDLLDLALPGLPLNTTLGGLIRICKGSPLAQGCAALEPVVTGLCGLPGLSTTPLCTTPGLQTDKKTGAAAGSGSAAAAGGADPAEVKAALSKAIQALIGGGSTSAPPTGADGSSGGSTGADGGTQPGGLSGLSGLLKGLGLGRAQLGNSFRTAAAHDVFKLAGDGYDTGIGTLLFQGAFE